MVKFESLKSLKDKKEKLKHEKFQILTLIYSKKEQQVLQNFNISVTKSYKQYGDSNKQYGDSNKQYGDSNKLENSNLLEFIKQIGNNDLTSITCLNTILLK